jgi:hypothetical protein
VNRHLFIISSFTDVSLSQRNFFVVKRKDCSRFRPSIFTSVSVGFVSVDFVEES